MKYLIAALLFLIPVTAFGQSLSVDTKTTARFYCETEDTFVGLIKATVAEADKLLAQGGCYSFVVPTPIVIKRYVGTYDDPVGKTLVEVYEATSPYVEGPLYVGRKVAGRSA